MLTFIKHVFLKVFLGFVCFLNLPYDKDEGDRLFRGTIHVLPGLIELTPCIILYSSFNSDNNINA